MSKITSTNKTEADFLAEVVVHALQEKKGKNISSLKLLDIPTAVADYFIICHGTSKVQVESLADAVLEEVKKATGQNPRNKEGFENAEWILIDYFDIVVHIFQEDTRKFYKLEELWADAEIQQFEDVD